MNRLVHPFSAILRAAAAWNPIVVLKVKFVVVAEFSPPRNSLVGENNDVEIAVYLDRLGHTVGVA